MRCIGQFRRPRPGKPLCNYALSHIEAKPSVAIYLLDTAEVSDVFMMRSRTRQGCFEGTLRKSARYRWRWFGRLQNQWGQLQRYVQKNGRPAITHLNL